MTLTGMKKHVGVLEQAGLVTTQKVGRVRTCKLGPRGLQEEAAWIERYSQLWAARFEVLDKVVQELKGKEKANGRKEEEVKAPSSAATSRWFRHPAPAHTLFRHTVVTHMVCRKPSPSAALLDGTNPPSKWLIRQSMSSRQRWRISPGAQSEASQQQKDGAVSKIFDVPSHGASSALARSSSERPDGNVACFHCHMRGMAYSKLAGSNPSPVL
jgi:hypothetical protein